MKHLIKKMLKLPVAILKKVMVLLMVLWKCWVAAWKRRNICVYLLARRYCKIKEKTILWEAFDGRGILDNPKALFEVMLMDPDFKDWKHVWALDNFENHRMTIQNLSSHNISFVENKTLQYYFVLATAEILVTNVAHFRNLTRRPKQTIVNTWHGIPLKGCGKEDKTQSLSTATYLLKNFLQADYLISASPFLSRIYQHSFQLNNTPYQKILEVGYPRLDTICRSDKGDALAKLSNEGVTIDPKKKILLYAPTWRGAAYATPDTAIEPYLEVKRTIEKVLDLTQWQVLIKPHQIVYKAAREQFKDLDFMIPATIDANEVLAITDVLASDFSSIFYDFLVTKRPIVFYIPDLEEYKTSRGLYHPVDALPGPICQTLEELSDVFTDLDAAVAPFAERYVEQRTWAGCDFDKGTNSRTIMRHILLGEPATIAEKAPEKKKVLFTLPPRQKRSVVSALIAVLNKIDFTQYDVTLFTEGDKIGTLERLANELSKDVRILVRRGIFRTFVDEVRWHYYSKWGASTKKGRLVCPKRYFQEEITRYLANNTFDEVIDVTGGSLFYTTFASLVPAKFHRIWAHDNLCETVQTTQKQLQKVFGLYSAFDEMTFQNEDFCTTNQNKLPQYCGSKCVIRPLTSLVNVPVQEALAAGCGRLKTTPVFTFSIIMAVYNVEPYLREAIESVIKQDIGFENHIQLILVNDGSSDKTGDVCDEYAAKYPENIIVLHQDHQGVAAARNAGIEVARGELLYFLDSDDKIPTTTLLRVKEFACAHNDVDVIAIPGQFYGALKDAFPVNAKCAKKDVVIDLLKAPTTLQTICATTFIRRDALGPLRFGALPIAFEEASLIQRILLKNPKIGAVKHVKTMCHSRKSEAEWMTQSKGMRDFYAIPKETLSTLIRPCLNQAMVADEVDEAGKISHEIPRFIQCYVAHYVQWMLKRLLKIDIEAGLSEDERAAFITDLDELIHYSDDEFLLNARGLGFDHRLVYLRKKYQKAPSLMRTEKGEACVIFDNLPYVMTPPFLQWHSMRAEKGKIFLCVAFTQFTGLPEVTELIAKCDTTIFNARPLVCHEGTTFLDDPKFCRHLYEFEFKEADLPRTARLTFHFTQGGETYQATKISRHFHFPLSDQFAAAYCILNKKCVLARGATLVITDEYHHWKKELKLLLEILKKRKGRWKEDLFIRVLCFVRQKLHCKPIWLLKDRAKNADDNAEAMFIHLCEKHPEVKAYFVIDKTSPDGKRLERIGKICPFASRKNRILSALSSVVLSSQVESWFLPEERKNHALRDMIALRPFVFLQHGVTKDFVSWLWKFTQNLAGLVAAATPEAQSFLDESYGYSKREIWLTGFPRFDRLYHEEQKLITFMPTWRQWLFSSPNQVTGVWSPRPGFTESNYFKFYNALLSNKRLITVARELGYTLAFYPHPMVRLNGLVDKFNLSDVQILSSTTPYREIYAKSNLVVTDYSSAVFDFAYLRKPVLYTHFDKDEMFSGKHTLERGYFDYERDGFGEVTYTLEDTVDCLIDYMKNGCQLKDKYRERIDHFFAFNDQKNCERVYQKVCELLKL